MKVYKYVLLTGNGVLPVVGCILLWTQIADNHARIILLMILLLFCVLDIGYYLYFRRRFVIFSEEILRNTGRIMGNEKNRFSYREYNRETLTSKVVMELEKMEDILGNRVLESEKEKEKLQKTISEIAHQVKIPLSNICMYHDMLSDSDTADGEAEQFRKIMGRQLEKLDELVKARFVELFGDPAANPMNWNRAPLSACLKSIDSGRSFVCGAAPRTGNRPAVLKLSAVTSGSYRPEENKAMLDEGQFVEAAEVHGGDLLFSRKNTPELVGMCAYVYDTPGRLMMPDLIFRLNTTAQCCKMFLWKLINHDLFRGCIQAIATGSAKSMSNISKERLLNLTVILPPIELQEKFAAFAEQTDRTKALIQKSLDRLETLKKSLMQEYFA